MAVIALAFQVGKVNSVK